MRLFITGGSGFLGRRMVAAALADGHAVTVLSRQAPDGQVSPPEPGHAVQVAGELGDPASLDRALAASSPDVVIHAAAVISDTDPMLRPINVDGTAALLNAMERGDSVGRIVFISSFAVEDIPATPYSDSKLDAEGLVRSASVPWVVIRPTLIYGPDDGNNTQRLVQRMRSGSMWLPGGGVVSIQPVFVDDVARACIEAATRDRAPGNTYRLGGPEPITVADYRHAVRTATGGAARIRSIPLPIFRLAAGALALLGKTGPRGVLHFHMCEHSVDSSAARRDLDFAPRSLADGLAATFGSQAR